MNSYAIAERINSQVNASVTWISDSEQFGVPEFWCEARSGFDDCDGYALLKRALLKEQGFDAEGQTEFVHTMNPELHSGIYILSLEDENNGIKTQKFVVAQ